MHLRYAIVAAVALAGCRGPATSQSASRPAQSVAPEPIPAPPGLRLPRTFLPASYTARLALTPAEPVFRGHIAIDGALASSSRVIWLHAQGLTIATATAVTTGRRTPLEALTAHAGLVALRAPAPLAAGPLVLELDYTGTLESTSPEGAFRQQAGGAWYAFTQFENTSARRAFPCFDEPDVKVPWQLTLDVPADAIALSNTRATSDTVAADRKTHTVVFARTRPLPSYLVAFAVGPFDLVDAPATRSKTPVRIVVPRGQAAAATSARDDTGPILALLEDYLGSPYPYDKLDIVAVPGFPGAMENAGLITFAQHGLLEDPARPSVEQRRFRARVLAHELAHQWFGDLVTMMWWDDVWLNEGFATWMAVKIIDQWQPSWGGTFDMHTERSEAMNIDRLSAARKIRQPIADAGDIANAFDSITYQKGASILRMFERWIGADVFQRGVRAYLSTHAWGNASSRDFLAALGTAAGRDIAAPFSTFLDRVGVPLVSVALRCPPGAPPVLDLAQQRYRPAAAAVTAGEPWQIPVCVRYPAGASSTQECTLLEGAKGTLTLAKATACPAWVMPNAGALGYHRTAFEGDLRKRLFTHIAELTALERLALAGDVDALVEAGRAPVGDALALVALLARDPDRHVVASAVAIATRVGGILDDALRPRYQRFVRETFGPRARALGWRGKPTDSEDTRLLRAKLVAFAADAGEEPALVAEASRVAWVWLDDRTAVPNEVAESALAVAGRRNDPKLHARLVTEVRRATDAADRARYLGALGEFSEPALATATLALVFDGTVGIFEIAGALFAESHTPVQRRAIYNATKVRYDELAAQIPEPFRARLGMIGFVLCEPALRDEVAKFLGDKIGKLPGGAHVLAEGLETMDACLARRKAEQPGIAAFLERY